MSSIIIDDVSDSLLLYHMVCNTDAWVFVWRPIQATSLMIGLTEVIDMTLLYLAHIFTATFFNFVEMLSSGAMIGAKM